MAWGQTFSHPHTLLPSNQIKVGAEFIGTFILMFAATAAAIVNQKTNGSETLIGCAATTGLAVMIVILATGHISGAHLNPAVTLSFAALKHFPWKHVPMYIGAQVLASICAAFALKGVYHPFMSGGVTVPSGGYGQSFALEFIIAFNLMFVVTAVATDTRAYLESCWFAPQSDIFPTMNIKTPTSPLLKSSTDLETPVSGGSMNPVRTLGPAIAANNYKAIWVYLIAPVLGALAGAGTYTAVKLPEEDDDAKAKASISFRR
ncbi:Aquaporin NIP6-1 NOD26-like intrinsic protein [Vigna angularis]|uniref:Aquaporin NIP6-1 NOD26-like intrinsic protein n=1 Tax=Phaseolus angularis TaxID=3914 RepID=A0A8T0JEU5_PHAAN|nr:Aquaporin NIP6-1 NOD26-like intrinsic protein [Vigna angularis]